MNATDFLTFSDACTFLKAAPTSASGFISVYRKRVSYLEDHFEGVILVPNRKVEYELKSPTFNLNYKSPGKIVRLTKYHFLGRNFRDFLKISLLKNTYVSSENLPVSKKYKSDSRFEFDLDISVDAKLLVSYCEHHRMTLCWVIDSHRFSERSIAEINISSGRQDFSGPAFSYFLHPEDRNHYGRPRMVSWSLLCGKRLLFSP